MKGMGMQVPTVIQNGRQKAYKQIEFLSNNSLFLIGGSILALVMANLDPHKYHNWSHSLHFVVNDVLMFFFFAIAAKEIREATLPGGALSSRRTAGLPLFCTAGGCLGPVGVYLVLNHIFGAGLSNGWAVPMATDIAFAYVIGRRLLGDHPMAIPFLLAVAVADDIAAVGVLAFFFPKDEVNPYWLVGLTILAIASSLFLWKITRARKFWWYLAIPGLISWVGFWLGGIHASLAFIPLAWFIPHAKTDAGLFVDNGHDTLNEFEHAFKIPVEIILGFFGFVNAGVEFGAMGSGTVMVLLGLVLGKPLGIVLFGVIAVYAFRLQLPQGMNFKMIAVIGAIAGAGFTMSLYMAGAAIAVGNSLDAVKMGALFSLPGAYLISYLFAKSMGIRRYAPKNVELSSSELTYARSYD